MMTSPDDSSSMVEYSSLQSCSNIINGTVGLGTTGELTITSNLYNCQPYAFRDTITSQRISLEEAEHLCGYQLLTHAGNLTKIIQSMKDLKKAQKQYASLQAEILMKHQQRQSASKPKRGQVANETDKLLLQKRDLQAKYEMRRAKQMRNDRQKEQFRAFLFSNLRVSKKKRPATHNHQGDVSLSSDQFIVTPQNLNQIYFDSIEDKIFTQIKIDLFSTTIRKQLDGFFRQRTDLLEKIDGKKVSLQIISDMNQNLKRKYIKKCLNYKKVLKGDEVDEPQNFLQQMIHDIKKGIEEKKVAEDEQKAREEQRQSILESLKPQPEAVTHQSASKVITQCEVEFLPEHHQRAHSDAKAYDQALQQQQQIIRQSQRMEHFEVKTISERSHEDTNSMVSSSVNTPGGQHLKNYLSGGLAGSGLGSQLEIGSIHNETVVTEYQRTINESGVAKKQIQILDLLNEICEENEDDGQLAPLASDHMSMQESETEKEEDRIMEQIMKILQTKDGDSEYQSLTYTDGIYLQNISGDLLKHVIDYLYYVDNPDKAKHLELPSNFLTLIELFETAEYLGLDEYKIIIVSEGIMKCEGFLKYTNVRRHYIENLGEDNLEKIFESFNPNLLLFTLTDPSLEQITESALEEQCMSLFEMFYTQFTKKRVEFLEKIKEDDQYRFVFDEDLMYLTKDYYEVYNDTIDRLNMKETVSKHILESIKFFREEFKQLPFDFHSCFYYDSGKFHLHRKYLQQDDVQPEKVLSNFKRPLILFSAIECSDFASTCLVQLFSLSKRFSKIQILNLRGLTDLSKDVVLNSIIKACECVSHLNLSFVKAVDDEVVEQIGVQFQKSLISLELRSCQSLTDRGIIMMCEALSGIREKRNGEEPADDVSRYRFFNRHETTANLKFLNLADLKQLTNKAMKSISFNLFPGLVDLSIWGCYKITNEGFLELCTAHRSDNFRKVNYCGCYKISDDSRLWISSSFTRVIIYNKVDDFGKEINYDEVVEKTV